MACSKQFSITVDDDDSPAPDCPLLDGEIWTAPIGVTSPGDFAPDPGYPASVGDAIASGTGAEFSASGTVPPFQADVNYAAVETSFIYAGSDRVFTVAIDYTIVGSFNGYLEVFKNGASIFFLEVGVSYAASPKYFQLLDSDAGDSILIRTAIGINNPTDTTRSIVMSGRITCEEGIGNEERSAHVDCGPECVPGGTGGDWTVPAGTVLRATLAEANLAAEALALARATGQSQLPENCCCMSWLFTPEEVPTGATAAGDSNILVATYAITTNSVNQVVRFTGKLLVPACAIPPGTTNIIVQISFANCGTSSSTYIWDYYDPSESSGLPLATQVGASGVFSHSRLISGGAGVMFRVVLGDVFSNFSGTGTVTISFS